MSQSEKSATSIFKDPQARPLNIWEPGILNTLVLRKLRVSVEKILREEHGEEYAKATWQDCAQRIISAHMRITQPELYKNVLTQDQVEGLQKKFPAQFETLEWITVLIDEGKTLDQLRYGALNC